MIHKIFSIYDEKARAFLPPFFMAAIGQAVRAFGDCVNSKDHQFGAHPGDYSLFEIGEFDDSKGKLLELDTRNNLGNGVMFVVPDDQPDLFDAESQISNDSQLRPDPEGGNSS